MILFVLEVKNKFLMILLNTFSLFKIHRFDIDFYFSSLFFLNKSKRDKKDKNYSLSIKYDLKIL